MRQNRPIIDTSSFSESDLVLERNKATEKLDLIFVCAICDKIVNEPISCSTCEQIFCQKCTEREYEGGNCGTCDDEWIPQEVNSYMLSMLNKVKLKCQKCDGVYKYADHKEHMSKTCPTYLTYACNAEDCPTKREIVFQSMQELLNHWTSECE